MTITIIGDYFDCHVYKHKLFLWDMCGYLSVYNWNTLLAESKGENVISEETLQKHFIGKTPIIGGIFPFQTEFYENHLFSAMQDGLFRRYIPQGKKLRNISKGKPKCLISETIHSVSININGDIYAEGDDSFCYLPRTLALPAGNNRGVLENKEHAIQSNHSFALSKSIKNDNEIRKDLPRLFHNRSLMFRDSTDGDDLYWLAGQYICRVRNNRIEELTDFDKIVNSIELNLPKEITGELFRAGYGSFGHILDFNEQLVIVNENGTKTLIIELPVTNWHVLRNLIKGRDLLVSVHDDRVLFNDIEELFRNGLPQPYIQSNTD